MSWRKQVELGWTVAVDCIGWLVEVRLQGRKCKRANSGATRLALNLQVVATGAQPTKPTVEWTLAARNINPEGSPTR